MYCHRCGNLLTSESLFCNRCGAKIQDQGGATEPDSPGPPRRAAHLAARPPRPARRAPVIPSTEDDDQEELEEYDDDYPERDDEDDRKDFPGQEQVIFSINPAVYEVAPSYLLAALVSVIITIGVAYVRSNFVYALISAAILFIIPIFRHFRLKHTVYTLTSAKLEIRTGIFSKVAQSIPLRHIDNVEVSETLKERIIGIGDVLIDSAALDSKMVMNNIKNPRQYANLILNQLKQ